MIGFADLNRLQLQTARLSGCTWVVPRFLSLGLVLSLQYALSIQEQSYV